MVHVDKMLRVVSDWRPLYEGERQKTVIHVQNTLKKLSNQLVEFPTLSFSARRLPPLGMKRAQPNE